MSLLRGQGSLSSGGFFFALPTIPSQEKASQKQPSTAPGGDGGNGW